MLLFLVACEQKTDLIIFNETDFHLEYTLDGERQIDIPARSQASHNFSLGRIYTFYAPTLDVNVWIRGPVYRRGIIGDLNQFIPRIPEERPITLRHDEAYRIRITPNRVNLIVENNCVDPENIINSIRLGRGSVDFGLNLMLDNQLIFPNSQRANFQIDNNINQREEQIFRYFFAINTVNDKALMIQMPDDLTRNHGDYILLDDFCFCELEND